MRVVELFSGVGSQTQALKNIGVKHRVVATAEIDKYAIKSYEALHNKVNNLGDISEVERLPQADLWTYSFPCQSVSVAGKGEGLKKGSGTRSGLLWEVERLLYAAKSHNELPKFLLLENVKNLVGKAHREDFELWLDVLTGLGYTNYWQVLNAKDYGVPQNRERVFVVSIKGEHKPYKFPPKQELHIRLKDILEEKVDERYYIKDAGERFFKQAYDTARENNVDNGDTINAFNKTVNKTGISPTVTTRPEGFKTAILSVEKKIKYAKPLEREGWHNKAKEVLDPDGISTCIHTQCNNLLQKVQIGAMRGRNPNNPSDRTTGSPTQQRIELKTDGITNAITTVQKDNLVVETKVKEVKCINQYDDKGVQRPQHKRIYDTDGVMTALCSGLSGRHYIKEEIRVRKLTPRECLRLMGFKDGQIDKIQQAGISNAQMYKQAGNSIVVNVLESIFSNMDFTDLDYEEDTDRNNTTNKYVRIRKL